MCKKGSQKILKNKFGELEIKSISLHPLSQTVRRFWRTKKKFKKRDKKFGKKKKAITFAAPKNGVTRKGKDKVEGKQKKEYKMA